MKYKFTLIVSILIAVSVSACSAQTTPATPTVIADTPTNLPTITTVPPTVAVTQTPAPTDRQVVLATETPTEIPTLEATVTATLIVSTGATGDPCNKPLRTISGGKPAKIKIQNNSGAPADLTLFLQQNAFGDCGYRGYSLKKRESILIINLIQGCYSFNVFINDPKHRSSAFGSGCINNPDKWTITITSNSVMLMGR